MAVGRDGYVSWPDSMIKCSLLDRQNAYLGWQLSIFELLPCRCCNERCPQPSVPESDLLLCARCRKASLCTSASSQCWAVKWDIVTLVADRILQQCLPAHGLEGRPQGHMQSG